MFDSFGSHEMILSKSWVLIVICRVFLFVGHILRFFYILKEKRYSEIISMYCMIDGKVKLKNDGIINLYVLAKRVACVNVHGESMNVVVKDCESLKSDAHIDDFSA